MSSVAISANTLFHFTPKLEFLDSILRNGFYVRYSLENYEGIIKDTKEICFPMVCFCDIPLSKIGNHVKTYGSYAIGLSKEWGMKKNVNPVIYTYAESITSKFLNASKGNIMSLFNIDENQPESKLKRKDWQTSPLPEKLTEKRTDLLGLINHFAKYMKPYEGPFWRDGAYLTEPVRFYDEREWRFTPDQKFLNDNDIKDSYSKAVYLDEKRKRAVNLKLMKLLKLDFRAEDVRFIIVKTESEIPKTLELVKKSFEDKATYKEMQLLQTRIISMERIKEDF